VQTVSLRFAGHIEDNVQKNDAIFAQGGGDMTATAAAANVVFLESHPGWRASRTRSEALLAAMRRHPSFQGDLPEPQADRKPAQVLHLHAH
jgi:hypothetical protein